MRRRRIGERDQHEDAAGPLLAQADDAAAADFHAGPVHVAKRFQAVGKGPSRDDFAVTALRGVGFMVVVVEPGQLEPLRLDRIEHAERHAGLHTGRLHALVD